MVKIIFEDHQGNEQSVEAKEGETLMEAAVSGGIKIVTADCGGACACGTCHIYLEKKPPYEPLAPSALEKSMLEFIELVEPTSRLSCQIIVIPEMEGMKVKTPKSMS